MRSSGKSSALRIALLYFLLGVSWIVVTDFAVYYWLGGTPMAYRLSSYKGGAFVLVTAVALYVALRKRILMVEQTCRDVNRAKDEFYRGTIYSVTEGRLALCTREEICETINCFGDEMPIDSPESLVALRSSVDDTARLAGMNDDRAHDFIEAVGEAAANAIKHAGGGEAMIGATKNRIQALIMDTGPGMDMLTLPRTTLMRRFSTIKSMGLGYAIILGNCDYVCLSSDTKGTWVLLEKLLLVPTKAETELNLEDLPDIW